MAKLPPPYLDGSLPAQTDNGLKIPFRFNRAASIRDIGKIYAKIKTVATDSIIGVFETIIYSKSETENTYIASFEVPYEEDQCLLTVGQFYKIQLAFGDYQDNAGYYSTVGVFKYTSTPEVYLEGMREYEIGNLYTYTGVYDQSGEGKDPTEKEYSYRFDVYHNDSLFASSGTLLHDSTTDTETNKSFNTWVLNQQLEEGLIYTLYYTVNTINGITKKCQYNITNNEIEDDVLQENYKLEAINDYDNGRIILQLKAKKDISLQGGFVVSRASSLDNYGSWNEIIKFSLLTYEALPENLWIDYTVEQGVSYRYSIQRFNDAGFYSAKILTDEPVIADFEDIFLYDGIRQLRVRFNPKVSSLKTNVLESKLDTIGGQYPFFFRNGDVKYKEFPVSGLISHLSDTEELFMSAAELGLSSGWLSRDEAETKINIRTTQVDTQNIAAERAFKLNVLDWLTNGQPKIFRSPGEGNYIVRLMNTSLSPNDTLSRMIHTFSSTAYEIADYTFENLIKYGFVENRTIDNRVMAIASIPLTNAIDYNMKNNYLVGYKDGVCHAEFIGVQPGTIFHLKFLNGAGTIPIRIPSNGYYRVNVFDAPLMSIQCITLPEQFRVPTGHIDVGYYTTAEVGDFSPVRKVTVTDQYYQQIGEKNIMNIITYLSDIKNKPGHIYQLKVETREDEFVYFNSGKFYYGRNEVDGVVQYDDEVTSFSPMKLYWVTNFGNNMYPQSWWFKGDTGPYIPETKDKVPTPPTYTLKIKLKDRNEQIIKLGEYHNTDNNPEAFNAGGLYEVYDLNDVESLYIDDGLVLDMMYQNRTYIYGIEEDDADLVLLKERDYDAFLTELEKRLEE